MTRRHVFTTLTLAAVCACLPSAAAEARPYVGFGEQNPLIFSDQRWIEMRAPYVRYVVAWDALTTAAERAQTDLWMHAAQVRHPRVLLSFSHSRQPGRSLHMPSNRQFKRQFRAFRARYPFVKTFQAWNEANHGSQPTFRKPTAAARIYDLVRRSCRRCTVTAPSVLDDGMKTIRWIKRFRRAAKTRVRIWSLHNHIDANRNRLGRASTTKLFLRNTKGVVWFTETGGIWNRWVDARRIRRYNHRTAVRAIRNIFKLARLAPRRVKRIYIYSWFGLGDKHARWDSGVVAPTGRPRPTLRVLQAQIRKYGR
jgi:hypothetical protein